MGNARYPISVMLTREQYDALKVALALEESISDFVRGAIAREIAARELRREQAAGRA